MWQLSRDLNTFNISFGICTFLGVCGFVCLFVCGFVGFVFLFVLVFCGVLLLLLCLGGFCLFVGISTLTLGASLVCYMLAYLKDHSGFGLGFVCFFLV